MSDQLHSDQEVAQREIDHIARAFLDTVEDLETVRISAGHLADRIERLHYLYASAPVSPKFLSLAVKLYILMEDKNAKDPDFFRRMEAGDRDGLQKIADEFMEVWELAERAFGSEGNPLNALGDWARDIETQIVTPPADTPAEELEQADERLTKLGIGKEHWSVHGRVDLIPKTVAAKTEENRRLYHFLRMVYDFSERPSRPLDIFFGSPFQAQLFRLDVQSPLAWMIERFDPERARLEHEAIVRHFEAIGRGE
jgi:hypothetical protein